MGRRVEAQVPWTDGKTATLRIRIWSFRERDIWDRKFGGAGDTFMGAMIGALGGKKAQAPGQSAAKEIQLARTLADDQRQRIAAQGGADVLERVAIVLREVQLDGSTTPLFQADEDGAIDDHEAAKAFLGELDADLFDRVSKAVDSFLYIRGDEEKDEKKT